MAIIILHAVAAFFALALSGLDRGFAAPAATLIAAFIILTTLLGRRARIAFTRGAGIFFPPLAAGLAAAALAGWSGAQALGAAAPDGMSALRAGLPALACVLAALAFYAACFVYGRTAAAIGLMLATPPVALLIAGLGGLAAGAAGHAASFGLIALIAIFTIADELRRRPALGAPPPAPLARRLLAPIASLLACFALLVWEGAAASLTAFVIAALAFLLVYMIRAQGSRLGFAVLPVVVAIVAGALVLGGGVGALGGGFERLAQNLAAVQPTFAQSLSALSAPPLIGGGAVATQTPTMVSALGGFGLIGLGALGAAILLAIIALASMKDGGRRPSRGFALAIAAAVYAGALSLFSADVTAPNASLFLALTFGLAASFRDQRRAARTQGEP